MFLTHTRNRIIIIILFFFQKKKVMDFYSSNRFFITLNLVFGGYSYLNKCSVYLFNSIFICFRLPAWCLRSRMEEKFALWLDLNRHFSGQRKLLLSLVRLKQLGHCRWTQELILLESAYFCLMGFFGDQAGRWK